MAVTDSTSFASVIQTIWKKELLAIVEPNLVLTRWASTDAVPMRGGDTVRFNRILRPAKQTAAKTAGTLLKIDGNMKQLVSNYLDFAVEIWEDGFSFDEYINIVAFVQDKKRQQVIAEQFARTHEYQLMKRLGTEGMWWLVDNDQATPYQQTTGVDAATSTTVDCTDLDDADDYWNNAQMVVYNPAGPGYDEAKNVTDFATANNRATVSFTNTLSTSSECFIASKTGLLSTDLLTTSALLDVASIHEHFHTPKFATGAYRAVMNSNQHRDLHADSDWKAYVQYDRSQVVEHYKPLRWFDIEALVADESYRTDVDNTENQSAGAVHHCPIFGRDTYGVIRYGHGSGLFGVDFYYIDKPDAYNTTLARTAITWKSNWAGGVLRATGVINLLTGATGHGLKTLT